MTNRINSVEIFTIRRLPECTGVYSTSVKFERGAKWADKYTHNGSKWFCNITPASLRRAQRAQLKLLEKEPK